MCERAAVLAMQSVVIHAKVQVAPLFRAEHATYLVCHESGINIIG